MSTDQEIIEARLAAYVEGDLPAGERAEIEKYLGANPQHAQLIRELRAQKGLVGSLPRERAPAEVLDHLQSHLERAALLENVEEAAESMRIRRWPQWTAIAAMLMLSVGLGVLVYQVLPTGEPKQVTLALPAMQQLPSAPTLEPEAIPDESVHRRRDLESTARRSDPRERDFVEQLADELARKSAEREQRDAAAQEPVNLQMAPLTPGADALATKEITKPDTDAASSDKGVSTVALHNSSAILVKTDDALITQNLVAGFLAQNQIEYSTLQPEELKQLQPAPATQSADVLVGAATDIERASSRLAAVAAPALQQQRVNEVVVKLREKEEALKPKEQAEEAYLLARNVPADKVEEITRAFAQQRGGRQQARLYTHAELYPELQQRFADPSRTEQTDDRQLPLDAPLTDGQRTVDGQRTALDASATQPALEAMIATTTQPTTAPSAESNAAAAPVPAMTDVLIIVRAEPSAEAPPVSTETTDPAATQPATAPSTLPAAP